MISNDKFQRLCAIDERMLNNEPVSEEELMERTQIIKDFNSEVDRAYLIYSKII